MRARISPRARRRGSPNRPMPDLFFERHLPHLPDSMFALVADLESYPRFLPNCSAMKVWREPRLAPHEKLESRVEGEDLSGRRKGKCRGRTSRKQRTYCTQRRQLPQLAVLFSQPSRTGYADRRSEIAGLRRQGRYLFDRVANSRSAAQRKLLQGGPKEALELYAAAGACANDNAKLRYNVLRRYRQVRFDGLNSRGDVISHARPRRAPCLWASVDSSVSSCDRS